MQAETGGDPQSGTKWVRSSLRKLSQRLQEAQHPVSAPTVWRLLKKLGFSLKASRKNKEAGAHHPDRDGQFSYIAAKREAFASAGLPIISIDAKKKELIGEFKNAGRLWCKEAQQVNVHDFSHDSLGRAVPYGIYDVTQNRGFVAVGTSADTPEFAVDAIALWWEQEGKVKYPDAAELLILGDGGGSNGHRARAWKVQLQEHLCERLGLCVTVCHYPRGCSKYNPIEHRLFGPISINWSGKTLSTFETLLCCLRGTATATGLQVNACLLEGEYVTGRKVSDEQMQRLNLERHQWSPTWNYTLQPRLTQLTGA